MNVGALLTELLDRLPGLVRAAVSGLTAEQLRQPPAPGANTVGWLVWHLTRVQDGHVAELLDDDQLWVTGPWAGRLGKRPDPNDTGYGYSAEQVLGVRPTSGKVLVDYYTAVSDRTGAYVATLKAADLDRIVDRAWDPPVTLGVRLVSVLQDDLQHVGQAAYARGIVLREQ